MAKKIPVKNVTSPRYLSGIVFPAITGPPSLTLTHKLEVYTGWIQIDVGMSNLGTQEIISFVPRGNNVVWDYKNVSANGNAVSGGLDVTVTVAPSHLRFSDDFDGMGAVDDASVTLEKQPQLALPGSSDIPNCLVLRAKIGAMHADVRAITYQVTVVTRVDSDKSPTQVPVTIDIASNSEPA